MSDVRLYLGDCLEVMRTMPDGCVDAVITDPPYGVAYVSNMRKVSFGAMASDDITNAAWLVFMVGLMKPSAAIYCFSRWDVLGIWKSLFEFFGLSVKNCIVWDKELFGMGDLQGAFAPTHEMILFASRGRHIIRGGRSADVIRTRRVGSKRDHPTEKPIELMKQLILKSTDPGDTVLDPFCGSGTTGVACVETGRNFIGIEIDPGYFAVAERRIATAQLQMPLPFAQGD